MRYFEKSAVEINEQQKRIAESIQNPNRKGMLLYWNLGSGKTIGAINAANKLQAQSSVVVPASLKENFKKELRKMRTSGDNYDIKSYEKFVQNPESSKNDLLVVDEAHRIRDPKTQRSRAITQAASRFNKTLLLTGTPIVNKPFDVVSLVNTAAGETRLPTTEKEFNKTFISKTIDYPGFFNYIFRGKRPTVKYDIKNKDLFRKRTNDVVDYYNSTNPKDYPSREDVRVRVPMSEQQSQLYKFYERKLPSDLRKKIETSMPPTKQDITRLNSFLSATRQLSNTTEAFSSFKESNPKIDKITTLIEAEPGPSVVYSNYLDSGLYSLANRLDSKKIPYGLYTGKLNSTKKNDLVKTYNSGKIRALLISSSGGEGLDLKNTGAVHIMEPHWNDPKIEQVIGRAIRYKSHEGSKNKNVRVYKYISQLPEKDKVTTDEYLYNLSDQKKALNDKFLELLKD